MPNNLPRGDIQIIRLSAPVRLAVPSLLLSSLQKNAIGFSFEPGLLGSFLGASLALLSAFIGIALYPLLGGASLILAAWGIGSTGVVMILNGARGMAFVKPLCTRCRLMPVIVDHEATHLSGVHSDGEIWEEARRRYTVDSLHMADDPSICSFCPIAKRLGQH